MDNVYTVIAIIASFLLPILVIVGIVSFIVYAVKNKDHPLVLNIRVLLNFYFYLMIFVITLIAVGGGFLIGKSLLSSSFGVPFSYELTKPYSSYNGTDLSYPTKPIVPAADTCSAGEITTFDGTQYCFDKESQKKDLITGITMVISMVILLAIHIAGLVINSKSQPSITLKKIYLFLSLGVYGIFSIIILPVSIYQVIDFSLYKPVDYSLYGRSLPGQALAWTIVVLPLWIYFLIRVVMLRENKNDAGKN